MVARHADSYDKTRSIGSEIRRVSLCETLLGDCAKKEIGPWPIAAPRAPMGRLSVSPFSSASLGKSLARPTRERVSPASS